MEDCMEKLTCAICRGFDNFFNSHVMAGGRIMFLLEILWYATFVEGSCPIIVADCF